MSAASGRRSHAAELRRPVVEAVVEDAPVLAQTDEARQRLAESFADLFVDVLVDALERLARGADPVAAVRAALAAAEGGAS